MKNSSQLGFWGLTGIVFGMMVGAGIYNIPQNMAAGASADVAPRHRPHLTLTRRVRSVFSTAKTVFFGKFH